MYAKLITLLGIAGALVASAEQPFHFDYAHRSQALFAFALADELITQRLKAQTNAEIISLRQTFVPAGRDSHTNFEISYGTPDGTGGYSEVHCFALRLISDGELGQQGSRATGIPRFADADEACE
jgi:hypothetical protein